MKKNRLLFLMIIAAVCLCFAACNETGAQGYTLSFDLQGGTPNVASQTLQEGAQIAYPDPPKKDGYRFICWTLNGEPFDLATMPAKDVALSAKWAKLYTLTFDAAGGSAIEPMQVAEGDTILFPAPPKKAHFIFLNWLHDGAAITFTTMPSNDVTLVAEWAPAITISFDTGVTGLTVEPLVAAAGATISAPTSPTRDGYHFDGWISGGKPFRFTAMPTADTTVTAKWLKVEYSNLPAMFINLYDANDNTLSLDVVNNNKEKYQKSLISVDNTAVSQSLEVSSAQFKGRGNGSWNSIKKGYRIKFDSKQPLLGNSASKHWVLLACKSGDFTDRSMLRNHSAYNMAKTLLDNLDYVTSAEFVDLYFNGAYHGVYVVAEHVRVASNRIDIESDFISDASGRNLGETGYLIEYDAYATGIEGIDYFRVEGMKYPFTMKSPDSEDYAEFIKKTEYEKQVAYIKAETQKLVSAVLDNEYLKFKELADTDSFIDMYILHELYKNTDTGWSSFYIYKKPDTTVNGKTVYGKFACGTPWDFDATAGLNRGDTGSTGLYVAGQNPADQCANELYIKLMKNLLFKREVTARWKVLSPQIQQYYEETLSDQVLTDPAFKTAMGRNYAKWEGTSQSNGESSWLNEAKSLRSWLLSRINWLNGEWK